jgi:hypothetical protein
METSNKTNELHSGGWWRFSRYVVCRGQVQPAQGAKLTTYDPWENFYGAPVDPRFRDPERRLLLFEEFVQLGFDLREHESRGGDPGRDPVSEAMLLDWCNRYGLPGTLLHLSSKIALAPRWTDAAESLAATFGTRGPAKSDLLFPSQRTHRQTGRGWASGVNMRTDIRASDPEEVEGAPLSAEACSMAKMNAQGARCRKNRNPFSEEWVEETPPTTWAKFFPDLGDPATAEYPMPLSNEFWRAYSEPTETIASLAIEFSRIAEALSWFRDPGSHPRFCDGDRRRQEIEFERAAERLEVLVHSLSPTVRFLHREDLQSPGFAGGRVEQAWISPHLLGTMGSMLALDLSGARRGIRGCVSCGKPFIALAPQHKHCSDKCRDHEKYERRKEAKARRVPPRGSGRGAGRGIR